MVCGPSWQQPQCASCFVARGLSEVKLPPFPSCPAPNIWNTISLSKGNRGDLVQGGNHHGKAHVRALEVFEEKEVSRVIWDFGRAIPMGQDDCPLPIANASVEFHAGGRVGWANGGATLTRAV